MAGGQPEADLAPLPEAEAAGLREDSTAGARPGPDELAQARSLLEDMEALVDDGKLYLQAELNYQKTRAVYVVDRIRAAAFFGAIGAAFGFIALIGMTLGAILTLDQWMPTSLASAIVVGIDLLLAGYFLHRASRRWSKIIDSLGMDEDRVEEEGQGTKE